MELAIIVFIWTATVVLVLVGLMLVSYLGARTELVKAQAASERRLH